MSSSPRGVLVTAIVVGALLLGCARGTQGRTRTLVDFLVYGRDAAGVGERLDTLAEAHWSYMDRFADRLVARGPTLSADGEEHTGSMHVIAVEDAGAARRFADEEPYHRAGVYAEIQVRRYVNVLGRSMWDRPAARDL